MFIFDIEVVVQHGNKKLYINKDVNPSRTILNIYNRFLCLVVAYKKNYMVFDKHLAIDMSNSHIIYMKNKKISL